MHIISIVFTLLIIIVGIAFAALNANVVKVNYLIGSQELPLAMVLVGSFAIGVLLSVLIMGFTIIKLKAANKWLESKLQRAQEEVAQLRPQL